MFQRFWIHQVVLIVSAPKDLTAMDFRKIHLVLTVVTVVKKIIFSESNS